MTTTAVTSHAAPADARFDHELRFTSLFHPGRGVVVRCDADGHVDLNSLSERQRTAYLGARALVGREYTHPTVHPGH